MSKMFDILKTDDYFEISQYMQAYAEGVRAFRSNQMVNGANCYAERSREHQAWREGWMDANKWEILASHS